MDKKIINLFEHIGKMTNVDSFKNDKTGKFYVIFTYSTGFSRKFDFDYLEETNYKDLTELERNLAKFCYKKHTTQANKKKLQRSKIYV